MEIVHLAPYYPNAAGVYEAARDMVRADAEAGHNVSFVDVGPTFENGEQTAPQIGAVDDRAGYRLVTTHPDWCKYADLLIYHTGVNDNWVVKSQAPIITIVHGRPLAAFKPEQVMKLNSYSLTREFGTWPRVKKLVYFWPEHTPYWRVIVPEEKLFALDWPPIDLKRFTPDGPKHHIDAHEHRGTWNALIADSWRIDVDIFEITMGAIEAAKRIPGLKVHFYAFETLEGGQIPPVWEYPIQALREIGALGEICGRMPNMEQVYRSMDFVLTPHRIVTRIIGEALSCGTPVLAANGCRVTPWTADVYSPEDVAAKAVKLVNYLEREGDGVRQDCLTMAQQFSLERYSAAMASIYGEAVR